MSAGCKENDSGDGVDYNIALALWAGGDKYVFIFTPGRAEQLANDILKFCGKGKT